MKIGIIGNGFVGKATYQLLCSDIEILAYDLNPELCKPKGTVITDLNQCEIVFVSVPTPMNKDGSCYLNIINSVMKDLKNIDYRGFVVLRSTVPAGTCDKLKCRFMPEFLTEKNFIEDFISNKNWIFGLLDDDNDEEFKEVITNMINLAHKNHKILYNNIHFVMNSEAELIKMFRNNFLALKVSFCNEVYEFCENKSINYENVRKLAVLDDRIGESHSNVPGHDGKRGFGGTCFPKDMNSLCYEMQETGMKPYILEAALTRNVAVDRPEKDWNESKGRAVVN